MNIISNKVPLDFKNLPEALKFIRDHGDSVLLTICRRLENLEGKPSNSNVTFKILADEMSKLHNLPFRVLFYSSRNFFVGHNVISHGTNGNTVNFNTRFHSIETFEVVDWVANWFHELTHLADQRSAFSFDHRNQSDYNAAPMVIARMARQVYNEMIGQKVAV